MSEQLGFIEAIRDNPNDDTHRLVYADWLEEQGQDLHAGFIRAHVAVSRYHEIGTDPFDRHGTLRLEILQPNLRRQMLTPFAPLGPEMGGYNEDLYEALRRPFQFLAHRGLIETVRVWGESAILALLRQGPAIVPNTTVRFLSIGGGSRWIEEDQSRYSAGTITLMRLTELLESPVLDALEELDLRGYSLYDSGVALLLRQSKRLKKLGLQMHVSGQRIGRQATANQLATTFGAQVSIVPPHPGDYPDEDDIPF